MKKLCNETLINYLKFQQVALKFDVIPKMEIREKLEKITQVENQVRGYIEMEQTEIIAKEHLNQRKEPENSYTKDL